MDTWYVYRCTGCGALTYPVQWPDGKIVYELPDETNVPDKCFMGHKWVLGMWEKI